MHSTYGHLLQCAHVRESTVTSYLTHPIHTTYVQYHEWMMSKQSDNGMVVPSYTVDPNMNNRKNIVYPEMDIIRNAAIILITYNKQ